MSDTRTVLFAKSRITPYFLSISHASLDFILPGFGTLPAVGGAVCRRVRDTRGRPERLGKQDGAGQRLLEAPELEFSIGKLVG